MDNKTNKEFGKVDISEEVLAHIANLAALEVDGVVETVGGFTKEITSKLSKKNQIKGIKVTRNDDDVVVDISIIVRHGIQIQDTCYNVQKRVKNSIEVMTGFKVLQVNINVEGIQFKTEEQ